MTTAKVELDVTILLTNIEILAEPGDRLMVYNGIIIGVLPKGHGPVLAPSLPPSMAKVHSNQEILECLGIRPGGITMRKLADLLSLKSGDTSARNAIGHRVRGMIKDGFVRVNPSDATAHLRFPRYEPLS